MNDNLPNQSASDDQKLKELEKELNSLEQSAKGELNKSNPPSESPQPPQDQTSEAINSTPPTPSMEPKDFQPKVSNEPQHPDMSNKSSGNGGMKKILLFVGILLVILTVGLGGYYLGSSMSSKSPNPQPSPTQSPEATSSPILDWMTYESESGWSIKYPKEVTLQEGNVTSFIMLGPTQKEGTEFYDGISLTISLDTLGTNTLKELVDIKAKKIEDDPVSEIVDGPVPITIANLSGYRLTTKGFGTFEYYYLPVEETGYLEIIDATKDPTGQGYGKTVEAMLDSLVIQDKKASESASPSASPTISPSITP
jgi:hypothetical protein